LSDDRWFLALGLLLEILMCVYGSDYDASEVRSIDHRQSEDLLQLFYGRSDRHWPALTLTRSSSQRLNIKYERASTKPAAEDRGLRVFWVCSVLAIQSETYSWALANHSFSVTFPSGKRRILLTTNMKQETKGSSTYALLAPASQRPGEQNEETPM
jgi:hypothetical protein